MFKIIYMCEDLQNAPSIFDFGLEMMDESFETFEEADEFIKETEFDRSNQEWEDVNSEDDKVTTAIERLDSGEYVITNYFEDEPNWQTRYKVVKVN